MATAYIEAPTMMLPTTEFTVISVDWRAGIEPPYPPTVFIYIPFFDDSHVWMAIEPGISGLILSNNPRAAISTADVVTYRVLSAPPASEEGDVD